MDRLSQLYDFPTIAEHRFKIGGHKYRVGTHGWQTLKKLKLLQDQCTTSDIKWSLSARPIIRDIRILNASATLNLVIQSTKDPVLRILAIWMRGKCRGTLGTQVVAQFANHPDFFTRKEVARALKRMSAWQELATMQSTDPDERIRRIASPHPGRPIVSRIAKYMRHVPRSEVVSSRKLLFLAKSVNTHEIKPPKPISVIRAILDRIRRLVSENA
jgi:hypothetical protein